jgi:hypothetical protein
VGRAITAWCLGLFSLGAAAESPSTYELYYGASQDQQCASTRGAELETKWVAELRKILPAAQHLWSTEAPKLFEAAASLTGKHTETYAVPVRLTLCDTPSQSFSGPVVNMRFALHSFTPDPVPLRYKIDTAFHESMHPFVAGLVPSNSRLIQAHSGEQPCVLSHLHLLSLQKAVLLSLGESAELNQVIAVDSELPSGCYKRAWALVNETDSTYKAYITELRGGAD